MVRVMVFQALSRVLLVLLILTPLSAFSAAVFCVTPSYVDFEGSSAMVTIRNLGDEQMQITRLEIRDNSPKFFLEDDLQLPLIIEPNATLPINIRFSPGASSPPHNGALDITSNAPEYSTTAVTLHGTAAPSEMKILVQNHDAWDVTRNVYRPGFWNDFLVFNRITGGTYDQPTGFRFLAHDVVVIRISNVGKSGPLIVSNITTDSPKWTVKTAADFFPRTLESGEFSDVEIQFTENSGEKGIRTGNLLIASDDPVSPLITMQMRGAYMAWREDTNEVTLQQITTSFGYSINMYHPQSTGFMTLPYLTTSPIVGEQVRSMEWTRANTSSPAYVRSLAAFLLVIKNAPEEETMTLLGPGGGQVSINPQYGQSFLPLIYNAARPAEGYFNTTSPFAVILSHKFYTEGAERAWTSNVSRVINMHFFPIRDQRSFMIPDTYVIAHDFILPRGCCVGLGCANCDYNDNVWLGSNIAPADPNSLELPPVYEIGSPNLVVTFDKDVASTIKDAAGKGTGFFAVMLNDQDTVMGSNSLDSAKLQMDITAKTLKITSTLGSNIGAINRLVNPLAVVFNPAPRDPYMVSARILAPLSVVSKYGQEMGIWVGTTKDYFAKLTVGFEDTLGISLSFMTEQNGVPTPPTIIQLPGVNSINVLELQLLCTPGSNTIVPSYSVNGLPAISVSTGAIIKSEFQGIFFGHRTRAGLWTSHTGANVFTATFSRFSVTPLSLTDLRSTGASAFGLKGLAPQCLAWRPPVDVPPPAEPAPEGATPTDEPLGPRVPGGAPTFSTRAPSSGLRLVPTTTIIVAAWGLLVYMLRQLL